MLFRSTLFPYTTLFRFIVNSRIKNIIIGTKHIKNANIEKQHTFKMEYFKDSRVNVEFGIMEDECSIILQRFFKDLRKK